MATVPRGRRWALLAGISALVLVACGPFGPGGEQTQECGTDEAAAILRDAGFDPSGLVVVEGCSFAVVGGLREGTTRNAAAKVGASDVSSVLEEAGVPIAEAIPTRDQDTGPWLIPSETDFQQGLVVRDSVDVDGRARERYVSWGRAANGDDYLIRVVLDSGSM